MKMHDYKHSIRKADRFYCKREEAIVRILVVDDEKIEREGMRFLIENAFEAEVLEAENGKAALRIIEKEAVDIVLTDIKMPFMDGLELIREAHRLNPDLEMIVFSAYDEFNYAKQAMKYGVEAYLLKPVEIHEFQETMKAAMENVQARNAQKELRSEMNAHRITMMRADQGKRFVTLMLYSEKEQGVQFLKDDLHVRKKAAIAIIDCPEVSIMKHMDWITQQSTSIFKDWAAHCFFEENRCYLLMSTDEERSAERITSDMGRLYQRITDQAGPALHMLHAPVVTAPELLIDQFRQLYKMTDMSFFEAPPQMLIMDEKRMGEQRRHARNLQTETSRMNYSSVELVQTQVEKIFSLCSDPLWVSAMALKHLCVEIIGRIGDEKHLPDEEIQHTNMQILRAARISELKMRMERFVQCAYDIIEEESGRKCIREVLWIINQEYDQDLSLEVIANRIYMTPNYVSSLFKQAMGTGLVRYLMTFRLNKACELLQDSSMRVQDIARRVGYANASYFCMLFRNEYGISPTQFREQGVKQ